ncbi:uncharacterized protein DFL_009121 [Arthrobotrys flagrans]|uniref:Phosphatidic acid phosphatase type 2/haloperoxidase domain-containing protein n=1 Tax=Arthrobotrys flagrans TaxID=97331 RepID=A0A436ZQR6_ARTFL|nr:hypothetical protein DFL_009121 [Arthrobotrys flagrans]
MLGVVNSILIRCFVLVILKTFSEICTGDHNMIAWGLESFPLLILLCLSLLILAVLMAGARSIDLSHHWCAILAGAILGILVAILCYRNAYAAVFDYRNHVPLVASSRGDIWEGSGEV